VIRNHTARLFVAVDPPAEVRRALADWARRAVRATDAPSRGVKPRLIDHELLHVTLCFLGARPVGELDALATQLAACGGPAGELSIGAPLWLPARNPRVLAVELHDERDRLARLQAKVVAALEEVGERQPDGGAPSVEKRAAQRRFHPHITVARMGRGAAPRTRLLPPTPPLSFVPTELVLYRSWLAPEGASYEAIASHPIG
jgi:2'-5' RNA ligase